MKRLLAISVLTAWCWIPTAGARAQREVRRVAVMEFSGRTAPTVRGYVVRALSRRRDVDVVPVREVEDVAARQGLSMTTPEEFQIVARELDIAAFIEGEVSRAGGRWEAMIYVRDGASGQVVGQEPWSRRKRRQLRAIRGNFWRALGPVISNTSAPERRRSREPPRSRAGRGGSRRFEQEPEPPAQRADTPSLYEPADPATMENEVFGDEPERRSWRRRKRKRATPPALLLRAGVTLMWRAYIYNDLRQGKLRNYSNPLASPAVSPAVQLELFPGAFVSDGPGANLGVHIDYDYAVGLKSREGDQEYTTTAYEFNAMALYRFPFGVWEPRVGVGYMAQVFDADLPPDVLLPAMQYSAVKLHAGLILRLGDHFGLSFNGGYGLVLDAGEIMTAAYFTEAVAGTGYFGGGIDLMLVGGVGLRVTVDWKRYFFDFRYRDDQPQLGDVRLIAGGALDDYLRFSTWLTFQLDGED